MDLNILPPVLYKQGKGKAMPGYYSNMQHWCDSSFDDDTDDTTDTTDVDDTDTTTDTDDDNDTDDNDDTDKKKEEEAAEQ